MRVFLREETEDLLQIPVKNLFRCPDPLRRLNVTQLTFGDLHGNAIKLLYLLVRFGILKITPQNYMKLVSAYQKGAEAKLSDIQYFKLILFRAEIPNDLKITIRLIGDILSDRGKNDFFTLLILEKLFKNKVSFEILFSNHDAVFLKKYADNFPIFFDEDLIYPDESYQNMLALISKGLIRKEAVFRLIESVFLPSLKLISYTKDLEKRIIYLFSHAPVGLEIVRELARHYRVPFRVDTLEALCSTIDAINVEFSAGISLGAPFLIDLHRKIYRGKGSHYKLIWSRRKSDYSPLLPASLGKGSEQYELFFIHGHDGPAPNANPRQINLDNHLGKNPLQGGGLLIAHANSAESGKKPAFLPVSEQSDFPPIVFILFAVIISGFLPGFLTLLIRFMPIWCKSCPASFLENPFIRWAKEEMKHYSTFSIM